ncbi:MAG: ISAs1 family transposase [Oscillospiraceae bacterium]|jgi:predicted transposase YbfD/YdcC|nr:ISAs1 family transposase [Oscillospiraceae bacterium]
MQYKYEPLNTLAAIFSTIEDPRDNRGMRHKLLDIFILTVFGLLWGHTDFTNMVIDLKYKAEYFTELLGLENGIPSHDTFSAAFSIIDPAEFVECFIQWIVELTRTAGKHIAIDGKAVRAACAKVYQKKVPMLINALVVETGICIGQLKVEAKTNEIKGVPDLLSWLDIRGAVVTTDAIGCQKEITKLIVSKGADFVLPVKDNQANMHKDIKLELDTVIAEQQLEAAASKKYADRGIKIETPLTDRLGIHQELDQGHSRIERRTYYVWNDPSCIQQEEWPWVAGVGMAVRERLVIHRSEDGEIINEEPSVETETYIISRPMGAEEFGCYARSHWAIENSLHWVLDDALREDRCTARKGHATENLGLMRKIVYNLLKLDPAVEGMSVRAKQVYYRNNPDAICRLIFEVVPGANM